MNLEQFKKAVSQFVIESYNNPAGLGTEKGRDEFLKEIYSKNVKTS